MQYFWVLHQWPKHDSSTKSQQYLNKVQIITLTAIFELWLPTLFKSVILCRIPIHCKGIRYVESNFSLMVNNSTFNSRGQIHVLVMLVAEFVVAIFVEQFGVLTPRDVIGFLVRQL